MSDFDQYLDAAAKRYVARLRAKRPRVSDDPDGSVMGESAAPKRVKRRTPERDIQAAIVADIRRHASACIVAASIATAQGSGQSPEARARYGAKLKAFGVWAGEPDLRVYTPGGKLVFLECKAPKGRLSPAQIAAHDALWKLGHAVYTVTSVEVARAHLAAHGVVFVGALRPSLPAVGLRR